MGSWHMPSAPKKGSLLTLMGTSFTTTGRSVKAAHDHTTTPSTCAPVVKAPATVLRSALRHSHTVTPYRVSAWQDFLLQADLIP
jgi:hypothetical protein